MFTGIVTELGRVTSVAHADGVVSMTLEAPQSVEGLVVGDSVAVNGVCLTAVAVSAAGFGVEMVSETLARSSMDGIQRGDVVNLERPLSADGRFDGHIVQGHVDGVGVIREIDRNAGDAVVCVALPQELSRYVVEKGSIAIDGVSLTVASVSAADAAEPWFTVALIPHTIDATVFATRTVGDPVNLEVDVVAKYVERMMGGSS